MRDGSAHRHRSWWAIEDGEISAGECDQLFRDYADAYKTGRNSVDKMREGSCESMESAALVMQIEHAVMVVGVRVYHSRFHMRVAVGSDWRRLIHIQRMVVDQRDNSNYLRDYEERQQ